jgi:hypothetical protein
MSFLFADASPASACLRGFARAPRLDPSDSLLTEPVLELQRDDLRALAANLIGHGRGLTPVLSREDVRPDGRSSRDAASNRSPGESGVRVRR